MTRTSPKKAPKDPGVLDERIPETPIFDRNPDSRDEWFEEIEFYEPGNPNALIALLPPKVAQAVKAIPPRFHTLSENVLRKTCEASEVESLVRVAFWNEYLLAVDNKRSMNIDNVYRGACSREFFYRYIVCKPEKLAFVVRPLKDYMLRLEELLDLAQDQMRQVMLLPIVNSAGVPNVKLISEKVKIMLLTENRVKGAVVNKLQINQRSLNVNLDANGRPESVDVDADLREIESKLAALQGKKAPEQITYTLPANLKDETHDERGIKESAPSKKTNGARARGEKA